ncbi:30S ribosomal protein S2 [Streptococcus pyogenes MGAS2111]|nr:30S ribosomal protein S2 [Streptococcus pyogenes MGAS2111]
MEEEGTFDVLPKKEVALLNKQRARLEKLLGRYRRYASYPRRDVCC